eukprot:13114342-Alexandrium_andersonii.AAC.1
MLAVGGSGGGRGLSGAAIGEAQAPEPLAPELLATPGAWTLGRAPAELCSTSPPERGGSPIAPPNVGAPGKSGSGRP